MLRDLSRACSVDIVSLFSPKIDTSLVLTISSFCGCANANIMAKSGATFRASLTCCWSLVQFSCFSTAPSFSKSPIQGGDGNVEFLAAFSHFGVPVSDEYIKKIVRE